MPILEVEIILRVNEKLKADLAGDISNVAGGIFNSPDGHTWVKLREMPRGYYAENGGGPPEDISPVFVSVLKRQLPGLVEMQAEAARLSAEIWVVCNRPKENVHILYLPPGAGRIFFGGS
ncbi:MAG: hypothetical protein FVQ83_05620 [Chloroflexi bacterium]|nr:hypothetical protein [Chloroflexota bacterium]